MIQLISRFFPLYNNIEIMTSIKFKFEHLAIFPLSFFNKFSIHRKMHYHFRKMCLPQSEIQRVFHNPRKISIPLIHRNNSTNWHHFLTICLLVIDFLLQTKTGRLLFDKKTVQNRKKFRWAFLNRSVETAFQQISTFW